ncbi:MAG: hypothetical protein AB7O80_17260 [Acetobacteraceae bacterium]
MADPPPPAASRSIVDTARAWVDVAIRCSAVAVIAVALISPGTFPILAKVTLKGAKVNILGSEFEIAQTGPDFPGLKIENGKLLLNGQDISALADELAKQKSANALLLDANERLGKQIGQAAADLARYAGTQAARPPPAPAPAPTTGSTTAEAEPPAEPVRPASGRDASALAALQRQVQTLQTDVGSVRQAVTAVETPPSQASTGMVFGIVYGADQTVDAAMTEVRNAMKLSKAPMVLLKRQGWFRSLAVFPTRDAATGELPAFSRFRNGSYVVDLRTWCPAGLPLPPPAGDKPAVVDCRF